MKLKLYNQKVLSKSYSEVFRNKELLSDYLDNVFQYPTDNYLEIDLTYIQLNGTLTFEPVIMSSQVSFIDWTSFNYIRLKPDANNYGEEIFGFIDDIEYVNGLVVINYSCDYWHTFSSKWTLRDSLVTRSRKTIDGEPFELPYNYLSNSPIKLNIPQNVNYNTENLGLIVRIQPYLLKSGGEEDTIRNTRIFIVSNTYQPTGEYQSEYSYKHTLRDIYNTINELTSFQNEKTFLPFYSTESGFQFFEILEMYIVPYKLVETELESENVGYIPTTRIKRPRDIYGNVLTDKFYGVKEFYWNIDKLIKYDEFQIESNPLIKTYGLLSSQLPYNYNGNNETISFYYLISSNTISIFMNSNKGFTDITNCFYIDKTFEENTPDTIVMRGIERKMSTIKGITGVLSGLSQSIVGGTQLGNASMYGLSNATQGLGNVLYNVALTESANAEKYKTAKSVNNNIVSLYNAFFGFVTSQYEILINENEVNKSIKETGYVVDYFTNNLDLGLNTTGWDFNTIKFDFVRLVGLSSNINSIIENILISGTKIWYNSTGVENA